MGWVVDGRGSSPREGSGLLWGGGSMEGVNCGGFWRQGRLVGWVSA